MMMARKQKDSTASIPESHRVTTMKRLTATIVLKKTDGRLTDGRLVFSALVQIHSVTYRPTGQLYKLRGDQKRVTDRIKQGN